MSLHTPRTARGANTVCAPGGETHPTEREEQSRGAEVPKISIDYFFMSKKDEAAHENPLVVMLDEATGEKYARAVGKKGLGAQGEMDWLIKDMAEELRAWGHAGGESGHIILKSDGERARGPLWRYARRWPGTTAER